MWNTHNIVAPSSWSIYDMVDRPLPAITGQYPTHPSNPRTFYAIGMNGRAELDCGTVLTRTITLTDISSPEALPAVLDYLTGFLPIYTADVEIVGLNEHHAFQTDGKIVNGNIQAQGPTTSEVRTRQGEPGYTLTISAEYFPGYIED